MCDNTAVSWSEQNAYKTTIEVDTRQAMVTKLLQYIEKYEELKYPESFIQGMERALSLIVVTPRTPAPLNQEPLF